MDIEDDQRDPVNEPELARPADPDASWTRPEWDRMWRPSMWLHQPPRQHSMHGLHIVAILALTGYANIIANQVLNPWWHIPFNLGILGVALAIARHAGVTVPALGYCKDRIRRGLVVGGIVMGVIGVGVLIGVAIPATREFFYDDRVIERSTWVILFDALIRIPIATAFYEETLFRGVLFGMFVRRWAPLWAALTTNLLFGLCRRSTRWKQIQPEGCSTDSRKSRSPPLEASLERPSLGSGSCGFVSAPTAPSHR